MVKLMSLLTGFRTFQKTCLNTDVISSLKRANLREIGCRFYSKDDENGGKLIQLVVTSLRVDRVAASGLGIARR
jgi:RNA-binding protein YlmH